MTPKSIMQMLINGFKLKTSRFALDIREKFSTVRMVRPWHNLPTEGMDAPSLELIKSSWMGL